VDALSLLAEEQLIQNVVSTMQLAEEDVYLMNIDFENLHHQSDLSPTVQAVSSVSRAYLQTSAHHLAGFISIGDSGGGSSSGVGNILKPNPSTLNKILTVSKTQIRLIFGVELVSKTVGTLWLTVIPNRFFSL
jgi:hypothetical protein